MKISRLLVLVLFFIITTSSSDYFFSLSILLAQENVKTILKKLDRHYYYPQKMGLVNIAAQYKWEQKDISLKKNSFIQNPNFWFYGEFKGESSIKYIKISDDKLMLSDVEKNKYLELLGNYRDIFIPKRLHKKFSEYKGESYFNNDGDILLTFSRNDSSDASNDFELLVDKNKWRLSSIRIKQKREPKILVGKFRYEMKDDKWVVVEVLSSYFLNKKKYVEKIEYTYRKLKSFWLVNKIRQTVQADGRDVLLNRFRLIDHVINSSNQR